MPIAESGVDHVSAPKDYADLFTKYYTYVVSLVARGGIEDQRKEDVAMEILLRLYERGILAEFDPSLVFYYKGERRPARFKSFLSKNVIIYLRGHRDKQHRLLSREPLICDMPVARDCTGGAAFATHETWLDVFGARAAGHEADVLDAVAEQELVDELREALVKVPRRSRFDTCDLVALFDAVVAQIRVDGEWNVTALRQHFGVSSTAMHAWMWWLRANLAHALNRPVPAKRPRVTRTTP